MKGGGCEFEGFQIQSYEQQIQSFLITCLRSSSILVPKGVLLRSGNTCPSKNFGVRNVTAMGS